MTALIVIVGAFASFALTWWLRGYALRIEMVDRPNARSSHSVPTPRGGGLAIVVVSVLGYVFLWQRGIADTRLLTALAAGGTLVAIAGLLDDRRHLPARLRLTVHFAAAVWALAWMGGMPTVDLGVVTLHGGLLGGVLGVVGIVWVLNLFNFMDGIDGIAGSEAVFVLWAGAWLNWELGGEPGVTLAAALIGAATIGFLILNWPPARIFMGDVGSGFLGFSIAVLAIASAQSVPGALLIWLVLGGTFFVDATVTLLHRAVRGERVHQAHRTHAYQWLARRWNSHRRATLAYQAVNLFWLLPWGVLCSVKPAAAPYAAVVALAPLVVAAAWIGAGRPE